MSLRVCTAEFMLSTSKGTGFAPSWLPSLLAERMATSGRDGQVDRAPDGVPFIDTDILWTNTSDDPMHLHMSVHRASRSLVTSNPNTVTIDDAYSFDVAVSPSAPLAAVTDNGFGARLKANRSTSTSVLFGRFFRDIPDWVTNVDIGLIEPGETVHFRYRALFSTPGQWRTGSSARHEMYARWCRLRLWGAPWVEGSI
ncbi:hypothetical protein EV641_109165 [Rhodococcus sp. SMB37]|uniref:DUF7172 family protein n=1 Tax=Rhodococcus sp. SMB37 TaxID=2512213 RepID=UPI00104B6453|nr:hypothetical protein [Rhodococcus sp. SMB37]TCN51774.1 hypothetical protein EV641_109165 [Rhodococcus sp. SMB37]